VGLARQKDVELLNVGTPEAIKHVNNLNINLILHLTCWR